MLSFFEILTFHKADRQVFESILRLGCPAGVARIVIALWLAIAPLGFDVIRHLVSLADDEVIIHFVKEAEAILEALRQDTPPPADADLAIPHTAALIPKLCDLAFFYKNRSVLVRGIIRALDGVCVLIFDARLNPLLNSYETATRLALVQGTTPPPMPVDFARRYQPPLAGAAPEDHRSMFLTFSRGSVFDREEIADYFNSKWENCVERVMMEKTRSGAMPEYGRIIFKSEGLIDLMLYGQEIVEFAINGKQLRGRKYVPRSR